MKRIVDDPLLETDEVFLVRLKPIVFLQLVGVVIGQGRDAVLSNRLVAGRVGGD